MKLVRQFAAVALAASAALATGSAHAVMTGYTTQAAFDAATASYSAAQTVDFEGVANGTTFLSGTGTGGLTFTYAIAGPSTLKVSDLFTTTSGRQYLGLDNSDTAFYLGDSFTIDFDRSVHAVGLYLVAGADALAGDMSLSVGGVSVFNSAVADHLLPDGSRAFYLGLVESEIGLGFTSATVQMVFTPDAFLAVTADDITSAVIGTAPVPEPGTWALMAGGLAALAALRRRAVVDKSTPRRELPTTWKTTMNLALSRTACAAIAALSFLGAPGTASAQASDPFVGQIMCAGFDFAPKGWAELNGQLLPIGPNTALFALIGTYYGGNGQTTFGLPDLRGRFLMHAGAGPGLTPREQGEKAGAEQVTLNNAQLPAHTHTITPQGSPADATLVSPANGVPATKARTTLYAPGPGTVAMSPVLSSPAGANAPVPVMPPYLAIKCFIALQGVFPSRP